METVTNYWHDPCGPIVSNHVTALWTCSEAIPLGERLPHNNNLIGAVFTDLEREEKQRENAGTEMFF